MTNLNSRDVIIQQNLYHINITNLVVKVIVKIKKILIRAIINIRTNVFIITLSVVKKLQMTIRMPDKSKIITVDQTKKNIINIMKDALLSIQDVRVLISLLVINISENNLLLRMN